MRKADWICQRCKKAKATQVHHLKYPKWDWSGGEFVACLSPLSLLDTRYIVTASSDGTIQIYTTDMDELLEIAKSRVTRQLTAKEKERYHVPDW